MTSEVSAVLLAGGQARRMGGVDKCLQMLGGKTLLTRVLDRIAAASGANPAEREWQSGKVSDLWIARCRGRCIRFLPVRLGIPNGIEVEQRECGFVSNGWSVFQRTRHSFQPISSRP